MSHHYTEQLAEFIAGIEYDAIPAPVIEHAKLLVLDALGCGLLGAALPWSLRLRATLQDVEGAGNALVWGSDLRLSAPSAAMANGTSVHGFELDDVGSGGHNGSVVLTSGLALAEHRGGVSGRALLTAVVAGIETAGRVQSCVGRVPHVTVGFHGPSIIGTFAAAAAACRVLGLDREQIVHALGHAGQQTAGLMATQHGGMGKRLLAGKAAHSGTFSALLASHGFTNVSNIFECEYGGFCSAFSGGRTTYKLEELVKGLGSDWRTPQANFKMWACRVPIHPTLEGLRSLLQTHALQADQVKKIRVWLDEGAYKAVGFPWVPTTVTSAQMNLAYCASIALLEGDVFVDQFEEATLTDPRLLELTKRIEIIHDAGMDAMGSFQRQTRLEVDLKDGRTLRTVGATRGGPDNPILPADVVDKFRKVVNRHLPPRAQDALISECDRLEELEDATVLTRFLHA